MSLRRLIVSVDPSEMNVTEFCAAHGVSTWFFYDLRKRFAVGGEAALGPRSRAPGTVANKTSAEVEDAVVAMRKELVDAGLDAGPATIAFHLRDLPGLPSESTIWRLLKGRGFIADEPAKAPKRALKRFTAERANECWQLDDTSWELADGTGVKVFNVIDDHSRLLVASVAMPTCTGERALTAVAAAAELVGWPERILSDNAKAFRDVLATAIGPLGVAARHSRPHHPQTNGKVERFHQTLKKRLAALDPADTIAGLQAQLDEFHLIYNHHRPHRGIGRRTPADAWTDAPKSGPADRPIGQPPPPTRIYTCKVQNGTVSAGTNLVISLGAAHNGAQTLTIITGTRAHVFIDAKLVRALDINPTRRVQALHPRPGRPPRLP
jgi:transposase InsO family protein